MSEEVNRKTLLEFTVPDPFRKSANNKRKIRLLWVDDQKKGCGKHLATGIMFQFLGDGSLVSVERLIYLRQGLKKALNHWGSWNTSHHIETYFVGLLVGLRKLSQLSYVRWKDIHGYTVTYKIWGSINSVTKEPMVYLGYSVRSYLFFQVDGLYLRKEDVEQILQFLARDQDEA